MKRPLVAGYRKTTLKLQQSIAEKLLCVLELSLPSSVLSLVSGLMLSSLSRCCADSAAADGIKRWQLPCPTYFIFTMLEWEE